MYVFYIRKDLYYTYVYNLLFSQYVLDIFLVNMYVVHSH